MRTPGLLLLLASVVTLDAGPGIVPDKTAPVTVLLDFESPHSDTSFNAMQKELSRILASVRMKVELRLKSDLTGTPTFGGDLMVFKMKGSCSMRSLPVGALSDERGPLAMTYSVDGDMLPFGEVKCDRVRGSLERIFGKGNPDGHQAAYGVALARVMAHEIYHMMAKSGVHTKSGLTRESLSAEELSQAELNLASEAGEGMMSAGRGAGLR